MDVAIDDYEHIMIYSTTIDVCSSYPTGLKSLCPKVNFNEIERLLKLKMLTVFSKSNLSESASMYSYTLFKQHMETNDMNINLDLLLRLYTSNNRTVRMRCLKYFQYHMHKIVPIVTEETALISRMVHDRYLKTDIEERIELTNIITQYIQEAHTISLPDFSVYIGLLRSEHPSACIAILNHLEIIIHNSHLRRKQLSECKVLQNLLFIVTSREKLAANLKEKELEMCRFVYKGIYVNYIYV